jgi:V-type H+-transporting ATPase subunit a
MNTIEIDEQIYDPNSQELVDKNVFIIFAHGQQILTKIRRISESLDATLYPIDHENRSSQLNECNARIDDITSVLTNTNNALHAELRLIASTLSEWFVIVKKEKAIYHTMNLFEYDPARKCLIAEGWLPSNDLTSVHAALRNIGDVSSGGSSAVPIMNDLRTGKEPPTFHRTNKLTEEFQMIIDSYGIAKYREVNPTIVAVVTFPFLFAVMFGDIGHGFIMVVAGGLMCYYEKQLSKVKDEVFLVWLYLTIVIRYDIFWSIYCLTDGIVFNVHWLNLQRSLFKTSLPLQIRLGLARKIRSRTNGNSNTSRCVSYWHGSSLARS